MKKILVAPRRYIQGPGVMAELGQAVKPLGGKTLVLWDKTVREIVSAPVLKSLSSESIEVEECAFPGEATQEQRRLVAEAAERFGAHSVIAFGGGKALDVAKGAAYDAGTAMVSCPTIASTDSPTSACSVWYDAQGNYEGFDMWPFNPDIVLVDTEVIVGAPVHTFVAGMGDALATWLEAEAVQKSRGLNFLGAHATMAALQWAKLSFDIVMEHGLDARRDVANHLVTPAVEKVVEANVLLSGIGFESVGLACAHDVGNLLSNFHECHEKGLMHGHKVGFGILTQLCLDDEMPVSRKMAILDFEIALGLPVTLEELGLESVSEARWTEIGDLCAAEGSLSSNHPFPVTSQSIVNAIRCADALGRQRKESLKNGP
jgi:glycerol dehydrogenase